MRILHYSENSILLLTLFVGLAIQCKIIGSSRGPTVGPYIHRV